jgi:D-sedoheptulose 7-phosphate isomerase
MNSKALEYLDGLMKNYSGLESAKESIIAAFNMIAECYRGGGTLLVCGNGGSAADAEHIVGELMKEYIVKRPIPAEDARLILKTANEAGNELCAKLQGALPAVSLVSQVSLATALANDVDSDIVFAQQVYGYARRGDVLLGISTSGNARNVLNAVLVAKAFGIGTVGLTGAKGGSLKSLCDVAICAPADTTWRIQEYHQPIYHALCAMIEEEFFPSVN